MDRRFTSVVKNNHADLSGFGITFYSVCKMMLMLKQPCTVSQQNGIEFIFGFLIVFYLDLSRFYCDYCDTYLTHDSVSNLSEPSIIY